MDGERKGGREGVGKEDKRREGETERQISRVKKFKLESKNKVTIMKATLANVLLKDEKVIG